MKEGTELPQNVIDYICTTQLLIEKVEEYIESNSPITEEWVIKALGRCKKFYEAMARGQIVKDE